MKLQLQALRKKAGFESAKAFAEFIGMSVSTYTNYEQGVRSLTLEKACEFADILGCTLDELAGRDWPKPTYLDERQQSLNDNFNALNEKGKNKVTEYASDLADMDKYAALKVVKGDDIATVA